MVEANFEEAISKPLVLAMGTLGVGKSTVLNRIIGSDMFTANRSVAGVTKNFALHECGDFDVLDTPGLNDPELPLITWASKLNTTGFINRPLALVLLCLRASVRPSA